MQVARRIAIIVAAAVLGTAATGTDRFDAQSRAAARRVTLSIVGTNDVHGGILPSGGRGGLALLAGYLNNLRAARAKDGGAVLLIDAGDMWQGTLESNLSEGASVVAAYNALGYTAAAIGNHEFDFGPVGPAATPVTSADDARGALKARAAEARFPLLAANLIDVSTGEPVRWPNVQPSVVVEAAGIPVGIIGVMTAQALTQTIAANTTGLTVAPLAETIASEAVRLRTSGAVVVIVAAHAGGECTRFEDPVDLSSCDLSSEIVAVARRLPRGLVDVIIAGHVHEGMAHEVAGVAITSAYSGGYAFGRIDLELDPRARSIARRRIFAPRQLCERENRRTATCDPGDPRRLDTVSRYESFPVRADARIEAVLAPAIEETRALKASTLGVLLETALNRTGRIESPVGNLIVDALRESVPGADAALFNVRGGLRADLPAGPLTYGHLFALIPFDNRVVTLQLTGGELARVAAAQLQADPPRLGISGLRIRAECVDGAVAVTLQRRDGSRIGANERMTVATIDFLALGGNEILTPVMPNGGFPVPSDAPLARDLIAEWLRKRGGSLSAEQLVDAANPRWVYSGSLPMRCAR